MPKKLLAIDANSLLHHHASSRALSRHAYHDHDGSPGRCHPTWNFKLALKRWSVRRHLESGSVDISIELQKMRPMTRRSWGSKSPLGNRSCRELQFSEKKKIDSLAGIFCNLSHVSIKLFDSVVFLSYGTNHLGHAGAIPDSDGPGKIRQVDRLL